MTMTADRPEYPLPNSDWDLSGDVALVTGASSGLGRRFATTLAAAGASVVVAARRTDRLIELVEQLSSLGADATAVSLDVTDATQIAAAVDAAEDAFGTVTILVNNAGTPAAAYSTKMPVEMVDDVIATNLRGPWLLAVEVARRLIAKQLKGRIVNVSSIGAYYDVGNGAALYSVTKAGVARMAETLAVEWAKYGINVNAIAPGSFASEMMDQHLQRVGDVAGAFPRRRLGDPAQLDSTLLYLVSAASEFVTGTVIKVDDGQTPR